LKCDRIANAFENTKSAFCCDVGSDVTVIVIGLFILGFCLLIYGCCGTHAFRVSDIEIGAHAIRHRKAKKKIQESIRHFSKYKLILDPKVTESAYSTDIITHTHSKGSKEGDCSQRLMRFLFHGYKATYFDDPYLEAHYVSAMHTARSNEEKQVVKKWYHVHYSNKAKELEMLISNESDTTHDQERRTDISNGQAYTKHEFLQFYGGLEEWHRAKPKY